MTEIKGLIKGITTKSKANDDGQVEHISTLKIQVKDLDRDTIEALAIGEHEARLLQMELTYVKG